ncbi:MAG: undecaprenyl-diphosphate phosphatase [Verrucomicrobiia bacterium]
MPEWLAIVILGIIEGVTEFLPVSSTGHLLLMQHWLPRQSDLFNTVIQCGTVLAVVVVFTSRIKQMVFRWRERETQDYLAKLAAAFFLTGTGGIVLKMIDFQLPETTTPVASATLLGGILFIVVEQWLRNKPRKDELTWRVALACGLAQLLAAVFPGASRSGTTILAGLVLGASRPAATEFSFLLGIPTLLSAGALQIASAYRRGETASIDWGMLLLGSVVAAAVAFVVVKWLLRFVQSHTFVGFGWYRIALGIAMLWFVY